MNRDHSKDLEVRIIDARKASPSKRWGLYMEIIFAFFLPLIPREGQSRTTVRQHAGNVAVFASCRDVSPPYHWTRILALAALISNLFLPPIADN